MSWIESHQSLLTHRKTLRASALLKVNKYQLIGHLHALWWWAIDNAKDDGDLGETMPEELAEAAGWPLRRATEFVDALTFVRFLDETGSGFSLHNWYRYAGKLSEKRAKDRERKADGRANSVGIPVEVAEKSQAPTYQPTVPTNQTDQPSPLQQAARELWMNKIGVVPPAAREEFADYAERVPFEWFEQAVDITRTQADRPNWKFCKAVLDRALDEGRPPKPAEEPMPTSLNDILQRNRAKAAASGRRR